MISGRSCGASLLEALPAEDRPALGRFEGNGGFLAATRTVRPGLYFRRVVTRGGGAHVCRSLSFAGLATLGLVLKLLIVEEKLLTGCKDEITTTVDALEDLILKFHWRCRSFSPCSRRQTGGASSNYAFELHSRVTANLSLRHYPGFGLPCPTHGHIITYYSIAVMKVPNISNGRKDTGPLSLRPCGYISPALSELSCGCVCAPMLLLRASFRPA